MQRSITLKCCCDSTIIIVQCLGCAKILIVLKFKTKCSPGTKWQSWTSSVMLAVCWKDQQRKCLLCLGSTSKAFVMYFSLKTVDLKNLEVSSLANKQAKRFEDPSTLPNFLLWLVYRHPEARSVGACFYTQNVGFFCTVFSEHDHLLCSF